MQGLAGLKLPYAVRALTNGWTRALLGLVFNLKVASILALIGVWWVLSLFMSVEILPGPKHTFDTLRDMFSRDGPYEKKVYFHVGITFARITATFTAAMILGIGLGLTMGLRRNVERSLINLIPFWLALPTLLVVFMSILWLGFSEYGGLLAVIAVVTPFVLVNIWEGTKAMDKELLDMAKAFKAKRGMLIWKVFIPQLMPFIFSAFRYGFGISWKIVLLAETFGLKYGIGFMVTFYYNDFNMDKVFAWLIMFVILMLLLEHLVFSRIEKRMFRWRHQVSV